MSFKTGVTPFAIPAGQWTQIHQQRAITAAINKGFAKVQAIWLEPADKYSLDPDWPSDKVALLETDLQSWIDEPSRAFHNVGFKLQLGFLDLDIDAAESTDKGFHRCILAGLKACGVDTTLAFGRKSLGVPSHVLVRLPPEEHVNFDKLKEFVPEAFNLRGHHYKVELRCYPPNLAGKYLRSGAKHVTMPGSIYHHKQIKEAADPSVWYRANGIIAATIDELTQRTPRTTYFHDLVKGIAFGVTLYLLQPHWDKGGRQEMALRLSGWLARRVCEAEAGKHDIFSDKIYCPVDSDEAALALIDLICSECGDEEVNSRKRTYLNARDKLARNPEAPMPGWTKLGERLGPEAIQALRAVFSPGANISPLTEFAERYIYIDELNRFVDLSMFKSGDKYRYASEELKQRHLSETMPVGSKTVSVWWAFERSRKKRRVTCIDMVPKEAPGAIIVRSRSGEIIHDDADIPEYSHIFFNEWRGLYLDPATTIDRKLMDQCEYYLGYLLNLLTCDNPAQVEWIKDWFAWTLQHPDSKQQIAWVVLGGMGVGKSFMGNYFAKAIFGPLHGTASPQIIDQKFNVSSFIGKLFVFVDEASFKGAVISDELKKLIRNVQVHGMEKGIDAKDYNIYARMMFASNKFNLKFGNSDNYDRSLFYTKAQTREYLNLSDQAFKQWTEDLKPFFDEFRVFLEREDVRRHYIRMLMDRTVDRAIVESTRLSSANDADILVENMTTRRRIARSMVQSGILVAAKHDSFNDEPGLDITSLFTLSEFNQRVHEISRELGLRTIQPSEVMDEFKSFGLIELYRDDEVVGYRFTWKLADLMDKLAEATGAPLEHHYIFTDADRGPNDATGPVTLRMRRRKTVRFRTIPGGKDNPEGKDRI